MATETVFGFLVVGGTVRVFLEFAIFFAFVFTAYYFVQFISFQTEDEKKAAAQKHKDAVSEFQKWAGIDKESREKKKNDLESKAAEAKSKAEADQKAQEAAAKVAQDQKDREDTLGKIKEQMVEAIHQLREIHGDHLMRGEKKYLDEAVAHLQLVQKLCTKLAKEVHETSKGLRGKRLQLMDDVYKEFHELREFARAIIKQIRRAPKKRGNEEDYAVWQKEVREYVGIMYAKFVKLYKDIEDFIANDKAALDRDIKQIQKDLAQLQQEIDIEEAKRKAEEQLNDQVDEKNKEGGEGSGLPPGTRYKVRARPHSVYIPESKRSK